MGIIIVVIVLGIWGLGIFLGIIGGFSKSFTHAPGGADSASEQSQEQKIIDDTQAKQQKMMDDIKQKMEDANRKF